VFFCSSRRRHTSFSSDWSSDVCSSDLRGAALLAGSLALQCSLAAQAQVYRCTDASGNKLYTDTKKGNCDLIDSGPAPRPPAASRSEERRVGRGSAGVGVGVEMGVHDTT